MQKLTLETDYKINGNSTGCALDTLAIAVDGRDSNDIDENMFEAEDAAIDYVLEHYDYENAARKVERDRQAAYKAEQAARAEVERKATIKKLISSK